MIEAYRQLADVTDHPLHLGVTEAGPPPAGLVKATAGIATLLAEGIGDTIRYSLTAPPVEEARAGRQLLEALGLRQRRSVVDLGVGHVMPPAALRSLRRAAGDEYLAARQTADHELGMLERRHRHGRNFAPVADVSRRSPAPIAESPVGLVALVLEREHPQCELAESVGIGRSDEFAHRGEHPPRYLSRQR